MILQAFIAGAVTLGFVAAALFFLRFWRDTRDDLFLCFGIAFLLLGAAQALLALGGVPQEQRTWVYLLRLLANLLILAGIARKNLKGG